jgi:hypothetical protein
MARLLIALLATFIASEAAACSCISRGGVDDAFKNADAVFAGVVVSIEDPRGDRTRALSEAERLAAAQQALEDRSRGPRSGRKVTFRVMQWWKTEAFNETVQVWTLYGGGDCGYPVEPGKSYLVYARRDLHNRLTFGICGRNAALVCASEDLKELGEPIKTYETFDTASLVKREEPYTTYWRPCIQNAVLLGERGLEMDKHCRFTVEGVIGRDGTVRDFRIVNPRPSRLCPASLEAHVTERVAFWRFRAATLEGEPIESHLTSISLREPIDEAQHAKWLQERAEWEAKKKPK